MALAVAAALALLSWSEPPPASAHLGNLSYADFEARGPVVGMRFRYAAHVTPGAGGVVPATRAEVLALETAITKWLSASVELDAGAGKCTVAIDNIVGPDRNEDLEVTASWDCRVPEVKGLRLRFRPLAFVMPEWQTIATLALGGQNYSTVFAPDALHWRVGEITAAADAPAGEEASTASSFTSFFLLGVHHIWTGYDHLLFLLAVLLAGGGIGRLAAIVTSFTVAHSFTLGAAATGLVQLPVAPVEAAIALSIVYVAAENLFERGADRRALVTFAFGLVHGFGFASILAETALPPGGVLVPLLAFNLGVEAGQLAVVVVVVPLLAILLRGEQARRVRVALSVLIALAGAAWAVERVAAIVSAGA